MEQTASPCRRALTHRPPPIYNCSLHIVGRFKNIFKPSNSLPCCHIMLNANVLRALLSILIIRLFYTYRDAITLNSILSICFFFVICHHRIGEQELYKSKKAVFFFLISHALKCLIKSLCSVFGSGWLHMYQAWPGGLSFLVLVVCWYEINLLKVIWKNLPFHQCILSLAFQLVSFQQQLIVRFLSTIFRSCLLSEIWAGLKII